MRAGLDVGESFAPLDMRPLDAALGGRGGAAGGCRRRSGSGGGALRCCRCGRRPRARRHALCHHWHTRPVAHRQIWLQRRACSRNSPCIGRVRRLRTAARPVPLLPAHPSVRSAHEAERWRPAPVPKRRGGDKGYAKDQQRLRPQEGAVPLPQQECGAPATRRVEQAPARELERRQPERVGCLAAPRRAP